MPDEYLFFKQIIKFVFQGTDHVSQGTDQVRLPIELFNFSADYLGYSKQRTEEICVMNSIC